jgi:hypothetical protein
MYEIASSDVRIALRNSEFRFENARHIKKARRIENFPIFLLNIIFPTFSNVAARV